MPHQLSIVIVNYNGGNELIECLESLQAVRGELDFEVIVVDNGSRDGSIEKAQAAFSWITFRLLDGNHGFAGGCNAGLEAASGRHRMLLNPDTRVLPGTLGKLVGAFDRYPECGIVGPRMTDPTGRPYSAARRFPTPFYLFCEHSYLSRLFPKSRRFSGYTYGECGMNSPELVDQIEGSALIIRGDVHAKIGDLDERFFLFFEEVDWCRRVREAGFEVRQVPEAIVKHRSSTVMKRHYIEARAAHAVSTMKYFHKYEGFSGLKSARKWMRAALAIRTVCLSLAGLFNRKSDLALRLQATAAERKIYRQGLPDLESSD